MSLKQLWTTVLDKGYAVRLDNRNGRKVWQILKENFDGGFAKEPKIPMRKEFMKLTNTYKSGSDLKDHVTASFLCGSTLLENTIDNVLNEGNHFFIQHFRIPVMEKFELSITKLFQIAYNAGQFKAELEKNTYSKECVEFYFDNKLDQIETYIGFEHANAPFKFIY